MYERRKQKGGGTGANQHNAQPPEKREAAGETRYELAKELGVGKTTIDTLAAVSSGTLPELLADG